MRTMRSLRALLVCLGAFGLACFAPAAWSQTQLVLAQSELGFTSTQMGVPVNGRFRTFEAQVSLDPRKPADASINLRIDLRTASLGAAETEAELAGAEWFNSKAFTHATFASSSVKSLGGGRFDAIGKLTIKGIARDVSVPFALAQTAGNTTATGSFVIERLAFNIGDGAWKDTSIVANPVTVKFKFVLTGMPPL